MSVFKMRNFRIPAYKTKKRAENFDSSCHIARFQPFLSAVSGAQRNLARQLVLHLFFLFFSPKDNFL